MVGEIPLGNRRKPKLYGDPFVRVYSILNNLRLRYKDVNKSNQLKRSIDIPDFGIRIIFSTENKLHSLSYKNMLFNVDFDEKEITKFGSNLMWHLIDNGYMAYIRGHIDGGNEHIFRKLIVSEGWGKKILDKRIEEWSKNPYKTFITEWLTSLVENYSTTEIIARYPTIYDFLF
jgi:hypothetical protein